jgi:hypothetical protein
MSALEDRRQAAREAGWDATVGWSQESTAAALDAAVETATRVRITPEMIDAATRVARGSWTFGPAVRAAFEAAGFEVEQ